jgi:hypothetical protein
LVIAIGAAEIKLAETGFAEPENVLVPRPGLLREEYLLPW